MRYIISFLLASAALPAMAEVPQVVTDLPPVQSLVAQVMGPLGTPALLLDRGADAHSFQMRPSQAASLQDADLVVWIGPEMTPWLDRALASTGDAAQLRLLQAEGTTLQGFAAGHDHEEQDHDAAHDGTDPHAWLDPDNARIWLDLIAADLSRLDPDHAADYAANAAAALAGIDRLDAELVSLLAPVKDKPIAVYHDAYGYFTHHFGLTVTAAIAAGDAAAPGARHLAAVQDQLSLGPVCLFPEANHDPKLALQLAEASGAKLGAALDPEGVTLDPGPGLYADLLRGLADSIAECLQD